MDQEVGTANANDAIIRDRNHLETVNSRDRMASQGGFSSPQLFPPSENEELLTWPPEHEVVVFRVRENIRHHRSDETNQQHCTEDHCLCDGSLVTETVEKFRRTLRIIAEYRSRMCPNTLKNCLSDPNMGVFFTWLELGPGWGDVFDEGDASMQALSPPPPANQNSTRNGGLHVEGPRRDQIENGELIHRSPPIVHHETSPENELRNEEGSAGRNVATNSANDSVESDTTYCAMIFKNPKRMNGQENCRPLQINPSSPGNNIEGQEVPANVEDPELQDSCAQLLETIPSRASPLWKHPKIRLNESSCSTSTNVDEINRSSDQKKDAGGSNEQGSRGSRPIDISNDELNDAVNSSDLNIQANPSSKLSTEDEMIDVDNPIISSDSSKDTLEPPETTNLAETDIPNMLDETSSSISSNDLTQNNQSRSRKRSMTKGKSLNRPAPASIKRARAAAATTDSEATTLNQFKDLKRKQKLVDFQLADSEEDETATIPVKLTSVAIINNEDLEKVESEETAIPAQPLCSEDDQCQTGTKNDTDKLKQSHEPSNLNTKSESSENALDKTMMGASGVQIISESGGSGNSEMPSMSGIKRKNGRKEIASSQAQSIQNKITSSNSPSDEDDIQILEVVSSVSTRSSSTDCIDNAKKTTHSFRKGCSNSSEDVTTRILSSSESSKKIDTTKDKDKVKNVGPAATESIRITFDKSKTKGLETHTRAFNIHEKNKPTCDTDNVIEIELERPGWEFRGPPRKFPHASGSVLQKTVSQPCSSSLSPTPTTANDDTSASTCGFKKAQKDKQVPTPPLKRTASLPVTSVPATSKALRDKKQIFDPRTEAVKISPKSVPKVTNTTVTESLHLPAMKDRSSSSSSTSMQGIARQDEDKNMTSTVGKISSKSSINQPSGNSSKSNSKNSAADGTGGSHGSSMNFVDGEVRMLPASANTNKIYNSTSNTSRAVSDHRPSSTGAQLSSTSASFSTNTSNNPSRKSDTDKRNTSNDERDGSNCERSRSSSGSRNESFSRNEQNISYIGASFRGRSSHGGGGNRPTQLPMSPPQTPPDPTTPQPLMSIDTPLSATSNRGGRSSTGSSKNSDSERNPQRTETRTNRRHRNNARKGGGGTWRRAHHAPSQSEAYGQQPQSSPSFYDDYEYDNSNEMQWYNQQQSFEYPNHYQSRGRPYRGGNERNNRGDFMHRGGGSQGFNPGNSSAPFPSWF